MNGILPTDAVEYVVHSTLDKHKHVVSGTCGCGENLGAPHGRYTAAMREHTAEKVATALRDAGLIADGSAR